MFACGYQNGMGHVILLGPPARCQLLPFLFWGRFGSPTKMGYSKKSGTLILTSLLEDLDFFVDLRAGGGEGEASQLPSAHGRARW